MSSATVVDRYGRPRVSEGLKNATCAATKHPVTNPRQVGTHCPCRRRKAESAVGGTTSTDTSRRNTHLHAGSPSRTSGPLQPSLHACPCEQTCWKRNADASFGIKSSRSRREVVRVFIRMEGRLRAREREDEQMVVPKVMLAMVIELEGNVLWTEDSSQSVG